MLAFEANNAPKTIMIGDKDNDMEPINDEQSDNGILLSQNKADFSKVRIVNGKNATKTITTPRGKDYEVVLSDGTEVLLNADSKLISQSSSLVRTERFAWWVRPISRLPRTSIVHLSL